MKLTRFLRAVLAPTVVAAALLPLPLASQGGPFERPGIGGDRISVTLVLVERDWPAMILRRAGSDPRNVIVLPAAGLDPDRLSQAIRAFLAAESSDPEGARRSDTNALGFGPIPGIEPFPWAAAAVQRLRVVQPRSVPGLPAGRMLELWLPPPAVRPAGA
jgi:hypothetical protein